MRAVLQRVTHASVTVDDQVVGEIDRGLLVLVGTEPADTFEDIDWLANRIITLRLFPGETEADGPWARNICDIDGGILVVSQFTLHAATRKGTKPSWHRAAKADIAIPLYEHFVAKLAELRGKPIATGRFGAMMQVALTNDGPVTIILDSKLRE